jgi:hypothetical protein
MENNSAKIIIGKTDILIPKCETLSIVPDCIDITKTFLSVSSVNKLYGEKHLRA